jgi:hypothetical protein
LDLEIEVVAQKQPTRITPEAKDSKSNDAAQRFHPLISDPSSVVKDTTSIDAAQRCLPPTSKSQTAHYPSIGRAASSPPCPDISSDDTILKEITDLASHPRLWKHVPDACVPRFVTFCRPLFKAYARASERDDVGEMSAALHKILRIPHFALIKHRGGKRRRAVRQLNSQLRYASNSRLAPRPTGMPPPYTLQPTVSPATSASTPLSAKEKRAMAATDLARRGHFVTSSR